ncbi:MAG: aminoacyl-histidine dipeptidase [Bacteroidales bacterium]|nr:aminoacyl-histidine dipeptidase [Bacteroidales bacterium]
MGELSNLYPKALWQNFESLTQIPRPSKKEKRIIEFMKKFGEELNLETIVDDVENVIIKKPATPGMENRKVVVLQGHLDMVPQKNSDVVHDFEKDPIQAYVDGEWVTAKGTTLGADNGMGVAAAMAVLQAKDIEHGPVEALFTIDEETGMTGAFGLKSGLLDGDILLNMDSEDEGELYIGCAGGVNANVKYKFEKKSVPSDSVAFKLSLTGLKGGHSGLDIALGRGNTNKLLNRFLWHASNEHGLRIANIDGGSLRNAIPRDSFAVVTVPNSNKEDILKCVEKYNELYKKELVLTEPELKFVAEPTNMPEFVIDEITQKNLLAAVYACPNGVIGMVMDMPGVVETSTNMATIKFENDEIDIVCLLRSSNDSKKDDLMYMIQNVFELGGAKIIFDGTYPGWKPNLDSSILKTMKDVYKNKYGKIPEVKVIHAGLECGIIGDAYPDMDLISYGPTIRFPHSPDEKVNIDTVKKFWDFTVETLKNIPVK